MGWNAVTVSTEPIIEKEVFWILDNNIDLIRYEYYKKIEASQKDNYFKNSLNNIIASKFSYFVIYNKKNLKNIIKNIIIKLFSRREY